MAEMPTQQQRSKETDGLAGGLVAVSAVVISLFNLYLQGESYVNWGAQIGYFWGVAPGAFSFISWVLVYQYFCYPEPMGLSMFEQGASIDEFKQLQAEAAGGLFLVNLRGWRGKEGEQGVAESGTLSAEPPQEAELLAGSRLIPR